MTAQSGMCGASTVASKPGCRAGWWLRGGRPVGNARDSDLSEAIGSGLGVNGSQIDDDLDLAAFTQVTSKKKK